MVTRHTSGPLTAHENDTEGIHIVEHYDDGLPYRIVAEHALLARLIEQRPRA